MDILFIVDPLASMKPHKETSIAMMRAAVARGHRVFCCQQGEISHDGGQVVADVTPLEILPGDDPWYRAGERRAGSQSTGVLLAAGAGWFLRITGILAEMVCTCGLAGPRTASSACRSAW